MVSSMNSNRLRLALFLAASALGLSILGCSFIQAESALPPTSTTLRVIQTTPVPTFSRQLQPVASALPESTEAASQIDCVSTAGQPATTHTVYADVDYPTRSLQVRQDVRYINRGSESLPEIVMNVEPNRVGGAFTLEALEFGSGVAVPAYELTGRRLVIELGESLEPGCSLELRLRYQLFVPPIGDGVSALSGYFGYTPRQFNLGHWLATVALRGGGTWITHEVVAIGEQLVSDSADWDVTLNVSGAPEGLMIAAPGSLEQDDEATWHFTHTAAREFALSMSDQFNLTEMEASNGVMVEMYAYADAVVRTEGGEVDGAAHALEAAARSIAMYSDLFGAYPYDRFIVVQGDFPDGMEFSDLVFVSGDWFRSYVGSPASYLTIITIHEVSHQWWYARVGSDQATTPWLDEALATYSELVFFEEYYPELKDWWWQTRVNTFVPNDYAGATVDSSVYRFASIREYINAVYLRGARMLEMLRRDLGTDDFFDWLRRYAEAGTGRVVTPDLFWSLLTPEQLQRTYNTRAAYLSTTVVEVAQPESTEISDSN